MFSYFVNDCMEFVGWYMGMVIFVDILELNEDFGLGFWIGVVVEC